MVYFNRSLIWLFILLLIVFFSFPADSSTHTDPKALAKIPDHLKNLDGNLVGTILGFLDSFDFEYYMKNVFCIAENGEEKWK